MAKADPAAWQWLAEVGFTVRADEGGLVLEAAGWVVEQLRADPRAMWSFAPVVGRAARLASAAGGRTVAGMA